MEDVLFATLLIGINAILCVLIVLMPETQLTALAVVAWIIMVKKGS